MLTEIIAAGSTVVTEIPPVTPNWNGPGLSGLLLVVGWIFAIVLVICVLGGLISGGAIAIGKAIGNDRVQSYGMGGLVGCLIGVAVCGVIVLVLNFVFNAFGG